MSKKMSSKISEMSSSYDNKANSLDLSQLRIPVDNLFFGLMAYLKDRNEEEYCFSYDYINKLAGMPNTTKPHETVKLIDEFHQKVNSSIVLINGKTFELINSKKSYTKSDRDKSGQYLMLLKELSYNGNSREVNFKLEDNAFTRAFIKDKSSNFTKFRFSDYMQIENKHAKVLFRLLSQFKSTGWAEYKVDDLKQLMGKEHLSNARFNQDVLIPSVKILNELDLGIKNIKMIHKKGNRNVIVSIVFDFKVNNNEEEYKREIENLRKQIAICVTTVAELTNEIESDVISKLFLPKYSDFDRELLKRGYFQSINNEIIEEYNDYIAYSSKLRQMIKPLT